VKRQVTISRSPAQTRKLAARLAGDLTDGDVLTLRGGLGSGKTCFVQGLAEALGIRHPVTSPTFTIVNEHVGTRRLYHVDLYRLHDPEEVLALGFADYLEADGITAVEWPERAGDLIPPTAIQIFFEVLPGSRRRRITIERTSRVTDTSKE